MAEEEDDQTILDIDPEKLTIPKLKSKLADLGVQLPMKNEKKAFYVDKFKEMQEKKRKEMEAKKRPVPDTTEVDVDRSKKAKVDKEGTPEKKTPSKSKRKSNPFQSGSSTAEDDSKEEQPKKKSLTSETPVKGTPLKVTQTVEPVATPKVKEDHYTLKVEETLIVTEPPVKSTPTKVSHVIEPPAVTPRQKEPIHEPPAPEPREPISFQFTRPSRFTPTPKQTEPEPVVFSSPPPRSTSRTTTEAADTPLSFSERRARHSIATSVPTPELETSVRRRPRVSVASIPTSTPEAEPATTREISTSNTPSAVPLRRPRRSLADISTTSQATTPVPTTTTTATTPITSTSRRPRRTTSPTSSSPPSGTVSVTQYLERSRDSVQKPPVEQLPEETKVVEVEVGRTIWQWLYLSVVIAVWILLVGMLIFNGPLGGKMPSFLHTTKFCNSGLPTSEQIDCVPCPPHGTCTNGRLDCDTNYVRSGKYCVLDAAYQRTIRSIIDFMADYLARKNGEFQCGYITSPSITDDEMKQVLVHKRLCKENDWAHLRRAVLADLPEQVQFDDVDFSSREQILPWGCAIRNFIWDLKWHICGLLIVFGMVLYGIQKKKESDTIITQAESAVKEVYNMLQEQALHARSVGDESYVAVLHLRDSVLKPPINARKRDRIWKLVEEVIKSDTRVQEQTLLHHGEQQTVWEWTAPVRTTGIFSPPHMKSTQDYNMGTIHDEGSTTAVEKRYPDLFPARTFRDVSTTPL